MRLRIAEMQRELVPKEVYDAVIDEFAGVVLSALGNRPGRCAPHGDLATRRRIELAVFDVRTEIAARCQRMADKNDEPPLA
ncbi:hypothetical protein [Bradyrhizobium sp. UFLA05-112]